MPARDNQTRLKDGLFWCSFVLLFLAGVVVFVPKTWLQSLRQEEMAAIERVYGPAAQARIVSWTNQAWGTLVLDSQLMEASYEIFFDKWDKDAAKPWFNDRGLEPFARGRLDTLWAAVYHMMYRFFVLWFWTPYMAPLLLAFLVDGMLVREIGKWQFRFSSPAIHGLAGRAIFWVCLGSVVLPFVPVRLSPLLPPVLVVTLGGAVWLCAVHLQKRI